MIRLSWGFKLTTWNREILSASCTQGRHQKREREERGGGKSAKGNSVPLSLISSLFPLLPRPRTTQATKLLIRFFPFNLPLECCSEVCCRGESETSLQTPQLKDKNMCLAWFPCNCIQSRSQYSHETWNYLICYKTGYRGLTWMEPGLWAYKHKNPWQALIFTKATLH